ncbi:MAG: hypothetical protein COB53_04385 [Elusimicrobia bacterium]|nr:MAG: hypothetical protein COB53_04385 [Elusimicrobiota bacterium]
MAFGWFEGKDGGNAAPGKQPAISSLLTPELIVSSSGGSSKDAFIETLVGRLCDVRGLGDPKPFFDRVLERERGISTTLDTGLAVPHARIDGIDAIAAALGLVKSGISDPKQPEFTIRAMFVFFSPNKQEHFTLHLQLLRSVSSLFQSDLIEAALANPEGAAVLELIRSKEMGA